jgi:hypothetical protein
MRLSLLVALLESLSHCSLMRTCLLTNTQRSWPGSGRGAHVCAGRPSHARSAHHLSSSTSFGGPCPVQPLVHLGTALAAAQRAGGGLFGFACTAKAAAPAKLWQSSLPGRWQPCLQGQVCSRSSPAQTRPRPNPSFNATRIGRRLGARGALAYPAPRAPSPLPLRAR